MEPGKDTSLLETLRGSVLSSIPALSVLTFVVVAVKVFRASYMETSTTVAIVSTADVVALLKGVVLTLLPGFLSALVATAIWRWAGSIPTNEDAARTRWALLSGEFVLAWLLVLVAFFTISWPIFLLFLLPMFATSVLVIRKGRLDQRLDRGLRILSAAAAVASVGYLTLSPTVWLPLRLIHVLPGHTVELKGEVLPDAFGAYVLHQDESGASLLLDSPRAVVEVGPGVITPDPPICIPPPSPTRHFFLRASQLIGPDSDPGSPYLICPKTP
jgi:hypothetical protein